MVKNEKLTAPDDKEYINVSTEQVRVPVQRKADPWLSRPQEEPHTKCTAGGKVAELSVTPSIGEGNGNALSPAQRSLFVVCRTVDCWSSAEPCLFR